jgi:amidase
VAAVEAVGRTLEDLGHRVVPGGPTFSDDKATEVLATMMGVPLAVRVDQRLAELGRPLADDDLEPFTRMMYDTAVDVSGERVLVAMRLVEELSREIGSFFVDHDLLLCPTLPVPSPPLGLLDTTDIEAMYTHAGLYASLTSQYNTSGQPGISLPLGRDADGLPLGVQLVARFGREDLLIAAAAQLEMATPWPTAAVSADGIG